MKVHTVGNVIFFKVKPVKNYCRHPSDKFSNDRPCKADCKGHRTLGLLLRHAMLRCARTQEFICKGLTMLIHKECMRVPIVTKKRAIHKNIDFTLYT